MLGVKDPALIQPGRPHYFQWLSNVGSSVSLASINTLETARTLGTLVVASSVCGLHWRPNSFRLVCIFYFNTLVFTYFI